LSLELVVFLIKEVNLVRQLLDGSLILLMLVLQIQFLEVLCWSEHVMKPKNLLVTDIYLGHELLVELGLRTQFLLKLHDVLVVCLASFVSFSYLVCPLVLVCEHVFLHLLSRKGG
jgi:hypothetical protein